MAASPSTQEPVWQTLAEFALPSQPDSDRQARAQVAEAVRPLSLPAVHLERLKTAVAEATLNAAEHGNRYQSALPVVIRVLVSEKSLPVRVADQGSYPIPPNLAAKLAGQQAPRGWGFFLIEKMVDDLHMMGDEAHHTIELFLYFEGGKYDEL